MEEVTEKILTIFWKNREWGNELEPGDIFEKDYKILVKIAQRVAFHGSD